MFTGQILQLANTHWRYAVLTSLRKFAETFQSITAQDDSGTKIALAAPEVGLWPELPPNQQKHINDAWQAFRSFEGVPAITEWTKLAIDENFIPDVARILIFQLMNPVASDRPTAAQILEHSIFSNLKS